MEIIKASENQYSDVRAFYHSIIDSLKNYPYSLGWKKDIYPAPDFLMDSIRKGELYIALDEEGKIIASMVINHECNDSYQKFQWPTEVQANEVTVIHALGVNLAYGKKGIGKKMVQFAIDTAKQNKQKVIRLDVLKGNLPAERLYKSIGFKNLHTLQMFYEDTGWAEFELYEYKLI